VTSVPLAASAAVLNLRINTMTTLALTNHKVLHRRRVGLIALVKKWSCRSRGRRELARMSGRSLQDIGLTPYDAYVEINKPFWRG